MLRYFNDKYSSANTFREINDLWKSDFHKSFDWPAGWPAHKPLVNIVCFVLMPNHYHFILEEIVDGGITRFMRKLGTGMTNYFNTKYKESGRLFQGAFKAKTISSDNYLSFLTVYINVKNVFELYAGGIKKAMEEFDDAFRWAIEYPYSSLADYADNRNSPIIEKSIAGNMFSSAKEYREFVKQCMLDINLDDKLGKLIF
jgi:putative transposase